MDSMFKEVNNPTDSKPDWRHYLFPSFWCFNIANVDNYPHLSTADVWIRAGVAVAVSLLFWPIALFIVFTGVKRQVRERKRSHIKCIGLNGLRSDRKVGIHDKISGTANSLYRIVVFMLP